MRGVNMVQRHQKQTAQQEGGIISKEAPIQLSNLALADPKDGKPTRVGFLLFGEGDRARSARRQALREWRSMADEKATRENRQIEDRQAGKTLRDRRGRKSRSKRQAAQKSDRAAAKAAAEKDAKADGCKPPRRSA